MTVFSSLPRIFAVSTIMPDITLRPSSADVIWDISKSPIFFKADAMIKTAVDIVTIAAQLFNTPFKSPLILANMAIDAIKSANKTDIAAVAPASFALSINEMTTMEPAKIAIAPAIFSSAPAFSCVWYASKQPLTPSRIPVTPSKSPSISSNGFVRLLRNFATATAIPPSDRLPIISTKPLKLMLASFSETLSVKLETTFTMPSAMAFTPWNRV